MTYKLPNGTTISTTSKRRYLLVHPDPRGPMIFGRSDQLNYVKRLSVQRGDFIIDQLDGSIVETTTGII